MILLHAHMDFTRAFTKKHQYKHNFLKEKMELHYM